MNLFVYRILTRRKTEKKFDFLTIIYVIIFRLVVKAIYRD